MELQPTSLDIWEKKYCLRDAAGNKIDKSPDDTFWRVANALGETDQEREEFHGVMKRGCYPGGRILANAGAGAYKNQASLINCTVSGPIPDSIEGILEMVKQGGITMAKGCGIGYDFSTIRPKGAPVAGVGAFTTGVLPFMDIYDSMCRSVASAGGRRGAQMGVLNIGHPDIVDYIQAKRQPGRMNQFNLSVGVTDEFMKALKEDRDWCLIFDDGHRRHVGNTVKARWLWDLIMKSTYDYADPGVLFLDTINAKNPLRSIERIAATNPCGEQPLPPYGACLLGSVDVSRYVIEGGDDDWRFDFVSFEKDVAIFTRMLDRVADNANLPLPEQREELRLKRRHGMGIMGFGTLCAIAGVAYGDTESIHLLRRILLSMNRAGWAEGVRLAKKKRPAPIFERMNYDQQVDFSKTISRLCDTPGYDWFSQIAPRFTHHTSIAPTGTLALSIGNNCSNGIEPSFAHRYTRNVLRERRRFKEAVTVYSAEALRYQSHCGLSEDACIRELPTAKDVSVDAHLAVQAEAQKWVDSAISKTINVPSDMPFEKFRDIYSRAYDLGLKGVTTFRYDPAVHQGVLVEEADSKRTKYRFRRKDGRVEDFSGNEIVDVGGEKVTAANLFDGLKELGVSINGAI